MPKRSFYDLILFLPSPTDLPRNEKLKKSNYPWRALTVSVGEMGATELAGVSKIAKSVICPLANEGISVLVLSTYQSDYILVICLFWTKLFLALIFVIKFVHSSFCSLEKTHTFTPLWKWFLVDLLMRPCVQHGKNS